jgi:pyruvate/2-oxoglutarate dehydrogenase complex dihydrolipoamide acyltransferase (E2) component
VLKEIKVKEGQTVPITPWSPPLTPAQPLLYRRGPALKAEAPKPPAAAAALLRLQTSPHSRDAAQPGCLGQRRRTDPSSPLVRRMAKEHGIDLGSIPAPAPVAASPRKIWKRQSPVALALSAEFRANR